jgi:hypothetical protein
VEWSLLELNKRVQESAAQTLDLLWELMEKERVQVLTCWWHWWNNINKLRESELPVNMSD